MAASTLTDTLLDSSLPLATTSRALPSTANRRQPRPPTLLPAALTGAGTTAVCALHGPDTTIQVQESRWKPTMYVILVELFKTGTIPLGKVAVDGGMFVFSLLCYRTILGAVFILPFALLLESGKWKELDKQALWWLFTNAFFGYSLPMALYYYGLHDTTASYGVIFSSLTPLFTLVLSILLGLYNGKELHLWSPVIQGITKISNGVAGGRHHLRGTVLLLGECICYAFSYPVQVNVLKVYPWKHWSSLLTCVLGGLQTCVIGIIMRRDKLAWQVGWNIQLLTIVYSVALGTAAKYWLNLYAVEKRGPVFPPMFNTLLVVFTMVLGALLLGESLTVGSLLGSVLVFSGLYMYLYGKAKELRTKMTSGSSNEKLHVQPTHVSKCEDPTSHP